mgnify:CR=1 FL=1
MYFVYSFSSDVYRGKLDRAEKWSVMPDLFFYRDPDEVEKEEELEQVPVIDLLCCFAYPLPPNQNRELLRSMLRVVFMILPHQLKAKSGCLRMKRQHPWENSLSGLRKSLLKNIQTLGTCNKLLCRSHLFFGTTRRVLSFAPQITEFWTSENESLALSANKTKHLLSRWCWKQLLYGTFSFAPLFLLLAKATISLDNSEYMRNGDYFPTRMEEQNDAVNLVMGWKYQSNPENTVGVMKMAKRYLL